MTVEESVNRCVDCGHPLEKSYTLCGGRRQKPCACLDRANRPPDRTSAQVKDAD